MQPQIQLYISLIFVLVQFWRFLMFLSFFFFQQANLGFNNPSMVILIMDADQ